MKRSAWAITAVLVLLAVVAAWFFGLDPRHAVVLLGAAFAAGTANGLLESVEVPRARLAPLPESVHGLAEIQSLEFSLSSSAPGQRAVLEVHTLAVAAARVRPDVPRSPSFAAFVAQAQPEPLDHRGVTALADELERILLAPQAAAGPGDSADSTAAALPAPRTADPHGHRGELPSAPQTQEIR